MFIFDCRPAVVCVAVVGKTGQFVDFDLYLAAGAVVTLLNCCQNIL